MTLIIINPNSTASMTAGMVDVARSVLPDKTVEGWTSHDGPPAIQGPKDGATATPPLLKLIEQADADQADGIVIGCFDDTGLAEAAARAKCPVLGIGQASYFTAALRQWRFSVVTTLPISVPILEQNIHAHGLTQYLGKVRASNIPVLELEAKPEAAARRIAEEIAAAQTEDQADAVVLGCAGMASLTKNLRSTVTVPIIDPIEAAARFCYSVSVGR